MERAKDDGIPVVYGDGTHDIVLEATEIHTARLLVVTTPDMVTAQTIIAKAKSRNSELNVVARTSDTAFLPIFRDLECSSVVLPEFETSLEVTRAALLHFSIPLMEIRDHMESERRDLFAPFFSEGRSYKTLVQLRSAERQFDLHWLTVPQGSRFDGRSLGSLGIRTKTGVSVVDVVRDDNLIANPGADFRFKSDDLVAVISTEDAYRSFQAIGAMEEATASA
ncbi:MAG: NAD-binding protein [Myxococcota bacterium]